MRSHSGEILLEPESISEGFRNIGRKSSLLEAEGLMQDWLEDMWSDSEMSAMHSGDEEFVQSLAELGDETAIGQLDGAIEKASRRIARLAMQTAKAQARLSILYVKKRQLKKKMKRVEAMRREEARNRATASPPGTPAVS